MEPGYPLVQLVGVIVVPRGYRKIPLIAFVLEVHVLGSFDLRLIRSSDSISFCNPGKKAMEGF